MVRNRNTETRVGFNFNRYNALLKVITAVFILEKVSKALYVKADWADGYFNNSGTWTKCQASWYTCVNSYQWTSCSNRILNSTTNLWDTWPDGTFYTEALAEWLDCKGSWAGQWASQNKCFDWSLVSSDTPYFSLSQMKCVSACSSTEVFIQDPQLRSYKLCRSLDYYVDPDSIEIMELGTK